MTSRQENVYVAEDNNGRGLGSLSDIREGDIVVAETCDAGHHAFSGVAWRQEHGLLPLANYSICLGVTPLFTVFTSGTVRENPLLKVLSAVREVPWLPVEVGSVIANVAVRWSHKPYTFAVRGKFAWQAFPPGGRSEFISDADILSWKPADVVVREV